LLFTPHFCTLLDYLEPLIVEGERYSRKWMDSFPFSPQLFALYSKECVLVKVVSPAESSQRCAFMPFLVLWHETDSFCFELAHSSALLLFLYCNIVYD